MLGNMWTLLTGALYIKIFTLLILVTPIFYSGRLTAFLRSPFMVYVRENITLYFYCYMGILSLFLFDSVKDMLKYNHALSVSQVQLANDVKNSVRLLRSQRNYYITGFSMVLAFVIKRILSILIYHNNLQETFDSMIGKTQEVLRMTAEAATADAEDSLKEEMDDLKDNLQKSLISLQEQKIKTLEIEKEAKKWRQRYEALRLLQTDKWDT